MTDKHITVDSIRWHSVLPWLHLLRAAQLALRVRVVLLALFAVVVFGTGGLVIRWLPFYPGHGTDLTIDRILASSLADPVARPVPELPQGPQTEEGRRWLVWPWTTVLTPTIQLFDPQPQSWSQVAAKWTELLWALLVWAIFGGAMARMHAVRFARDDSVSPLTAVRFSSRNGLSYLYGPLLPLLGVGCFALLGIGVGKLEAWIGAGQGTWLMALGWLPLLGSFVMAALLLLMVLGWPLMVAAISVEGSDGFDGLSRAFGYVMNRPWYFAFLVSVAIGIGVLTDLFVFIFLHNSDRLARWSLGVSDGVRELRGYSVWTATLPFVHLAVLVSFFWSATTVIYFLLRQSDDGTPLDQVYIPGPAPKAEPLPLVGIAASQQPVIERPTVEPVAAGGSPVVPGNS